jgi:hypothetical protein
MALTLASTNARGSSAARHGFIARSETRATSLWWECIGPTPSGSRAGEPGRVRGLRSRTRLTPGSLRVAPRAVAKFSSVVERGSSRVSLSTSDSGTE